MAEERRRVLFFCACERPIDGRGGECHRREVARLARAAADTRALPIRIAEWPGGEPAEIDLEVPPGALNAVARGRTSLPLPEPAPLGLMGGLAWGSVVRLSAGDAELTASGGPARFQSGAWCLPVLRVWGRGDETRVALEWAATFRRRHGYD
jgi:hypothetical protein